jgi:hypothetical protein
MADLVAYIRRLPSVRGESEGGLTDEELLARFILGTAKFAQLKCILTNELCKRGSCSNLGGVAGHRKHRKPGTRPGVHP